MKGNIWKFISIGIGSAIAVMCIVFALPLWTMPVETVETYTETEMKQEAYTVTEEYEVSRTLCSQIFYENDISHRFLTAEGKLGSMFYAHCTFYPQGRKVQHSSLETLDPLEKIEALMEELRGVHNCLVPKAIWMFDTTKAICAGKNAQNCRLIMEWSTKPYAELLARVVEIDDASEKYIHHEFAPSGKIEYQLRPNTTFLMGVENPKEHGSTIPFSAKFTYEWDDVELETRQLTKYHEVPVEVEKQRVVTKYEKTSMWELLFGTNTADEHAD